MNFQRSLKVPVIIGPGLAWPLNIILLMVFLFSILFFLSGSSRYSVQIPHAVTSDIVHDDNMTIIITGENILYYNARVITVDALRGLLSRPDNRQRPLLIKADRRASLGRIVDVWDLGRKMGVGRINIATDQTE